MTKIVWQWRITIRGYIKETMNVLSEDAFYGKDEDVGAWVKQIVDAYPSIDMLQIEMVREEQNDSE